MKLYGRELPPPPPPSPHAAHQGVGVGAGGDGPARPDQEGDGIGVEDGPDVRRVDGGAAACRRRELKEALKKNGEQLMAAPRPCAASVQRRAGRVLRPYSQSAGVRTCGEDLLMQLASSIANLWRPTTPTTTTPRAAATTVPHSK